MLERRDFRRLVLQCTVPGRLAEPAEEGAFALVPSPGCVLRSTDELWWFPFTSEQASILPLGRQGTLTGSCLWTTEEEGLFEGSVLQTRRSLAMARQALGRATARVALFLPDTLQGGDAVPHPLFDSLVAAFQNRGLANCIVDLRRPGDLGRLGVKTERASLVLFPLPAELNLQFPIPLRERESYSSLDLLFASPLAYSLAYHLRLSPKPVSVAVDSPLALGSLFHAVVKEYFDRFGESDAWKANDARAWFRGEFQALCQRHAAALLLEEFRALQADVGWTFCEALGVLVDALLRNSWACARSEVKIERPGDERYPGFLGYADLVAERGNERLVVDFKLGSVEKRRTLMEKGEDLQLALYSKFLRSGAAFDLSAYYIISRRTFLATDLGALSDAELVDRRASFPRQPRDPQWEKVWKTYSARKEQFRKGRLLLRNPVDAVDVYPVDDAGPEYNNYPAFIGEEA